MPPILNAQNVTKQFGATPLFLNISLTVEDGDRIGLIGPNGAGKSTLLAVLAGQVEPDSGELAVRKRARAAYVPQDSRFAAGLSIRQVLERAMAAVHVNESEREGRLRELAGRTGFANLDDEAASLSGGWRKRLAIAEALVGEPEVMLLDEPTNHLDIESIIWLEQFLKTYPGTVLMTSHDREFMNRIIGKVVEIDGGQLTTYSGNYEFYEQQRALNEKQQQAQFERQQAMLAKEIKFIERFKARASHAAQVQSRVKKLEKIEKVEPPRRRQMVSFDFPPAPRSGEDVATLKEVRKGYGARRIYDGLDFQVRRRERWCVMGVNGAGKSTLLKLVAGAARPDDGDVAVGVGVKMGYFAQHAMELLDGERTVFQSLEDSFPQAGQGSLRALAGCFGFSGDDVEKKCRVLSGGEKARLVMAKMLFDPPNFLVLDEPTNDLDMETLDLLQERLSDYDGTLILISHDRDFLDRVVTSVIAPEGDGRWIEYAGGYSDMLVQRGADLTRDSGKQEKEKSVKAAPSGAPQAANSQVIKREMKFKEKHALETLPKTMAALNAKANELQAILADPQFYNRDRVGFEKVTIDLGETQRKLAAAEEQWLELEILREELADS